MMLLELLNTPLINVLVSKLQGIFDFSLFENYSHSYNQKLAILLYIISYLKHIEHFRK